MNAEQKLVVALLSNKGEIESRQEQEIDWTVFIDIASTHRLIPLVYQSLSRLSVELPSEVDTFFRQRTRKLAMRNLEFSAELRKLSKILEDIDVEFLSYKGPTLAQIAYGDNSLRTFGDLDLFIRKQDFPTVKKVICENGGGSHWKLTEKQEKAVLKYYYEYPFFFGNRPLLVEIHWAFMEAFFGFDYEKEDVFGRSQSVSIHGRNFQTLSNEDLFIILCVHGSKHYWKRLSWIYDIAKLIDARVINWDVVFMRAKKFGSLRMLGIGAYMAKDLFGAELPIEMEKEIEGDKNVTLLAEIMKSQIFDDEVSAETIRSSIHMRMLGRWRDKFTYSQRLFRTKVIDSIFMPMGRPI